MEWYFHSKWMGSALAFLLYVLMNIARVFFFSGVTRLLWKWIYPNRFTVLATCDSEGKLVTRITGTSHQDLITAIQIQTSPPYPKVGESESPQDISKELCSKLGRSLHNFYISGLVLVVGSLFVNGAWVYLVIVTSQSLTPNVFGE